MDDAKVPTSLWFYALLHIANSAEGLETLFLSRQLGVSLAKAEAMLLKIRLHLAALHRQELPCAEQEEVFVRLETLVRVRNIPHLKRNQTHILVSAARDKIDASVLDDPLRHNLSAIVRLKAPAAKTIITTCKRTALILKKHEDRLLPVLFDASYHKRTNVGIDPIKGFMNYFLPVVKNRDLALTKQDLWLYLKEFEFRYNRRAASKHTFWEMIASFPVLENECAEAVRAFNDFQSASDKR